MPRDLFEARCWQVEVAPPSVALSEVGAEMPVQKRRPHMCAASASVGCESNLALSDHVDNTDLSGANGVRNM